MRRLTEQVNRLNAFDKKPSYTAYNFGRTIVRSKTNPDGSREKTIETCYMRVTTPLVGSNPQPIRIHPEYLGYFEQQAVQQAEQSEQSEQIEQKPELNPVEEVVTALIDRMKIIEDQIRYLQEANSRYERQINELTEQVRSLQKST